MRKGRNSKQRFASIERACGYARISERTIYRLIKNGTLHKYKSRNRTCLSLNEIDRWRKRSVAPHRVEAQ